MIVSRVDQVVSVEADRIKPLSTIFKGASPLCFPQVLKHEDALILILAPEGIEKVVQETGNPQNVTGMPDCGDAFPEAEETITLINEVAAVSDRDSIPLAGRWAQDESLQAEIDIESGSPAGKGAIAGMIPEIIDAVDIDDESQCESTSFLANLLQTDGGASSQAESADSE